MLASHDEPASAALVVASCFKKWRRLEVMPKVLPRTALDVNVGVRLCGGGNQVASKGHPIRNPECQEDKWVADLEGVAMWLNTTACCCASDPRKAFRFKARCEGDSTILPDNGSSEGEGGRTAKYTKYEKEGWERLGL